MSPFDQQLISRKAKLIAEDLDKLGEFATISLEQYYQSLEIRLQTERLIERIVGRVIDINYHILKQQFDHLPTDYFDSFVELGKKNILKPDFAQELAQSTGLRNALAHEYDQIDDALVYRSIKTCLTQIPKYLDLVTNLDLRKK